MRLRRFHRFRRNSRARYRFCMTVILSNFECDDAAEDSDDITYVVFDDYFDSKYHARHQAMKLYEDKTFAGVVRAEFCLYRVDDDDQLVVVALPTPTVKYFPFHCDWNSPMTETIRGMA